jgi:hypothetical protein
MPVRFCIVASPQTEAIANAAQLWADMDTNAREVVRPDDADYPTAIVNAAVAAFPNPGAVVLTPDGAVFRVLDVNDAQNGGIIDLVFSEALLA